MKALISILREEFHKSLIQQGILTIDKNEVPSNADKDSRLSREISLYIAKKLEAETRKKCEGQTLGGKFEIATMDFILKTFHHLNSLRPGKWHISRLGNRNSIKTSSFVQYQHLDYLKDLTRKDVLLASSLGNDYMVAPDIVVYREPEPDEIINSDCLLIDNAVSTLSVIRQSANKLPILHASISAKWTMRSDRAQNSRTEALGLIRNRKGHLPHIDVVTAEPLPSRLASLALGTGDIDCVYHFALYELIEAVKYTGAEDSIEMLDILIEGKRLKDISDLPLDLAI